jgi:hypothetical protein
MGESDVYGRARDVSFPPIIDEEKGKYGTLMEQSILFSPHQGENGRQWKDQRYVCGPFKEKYRPEKRVDMNSIGWKTVLIPASYRLSTSST